MELRIGCGTGSSSGRKQVRSTGKVSGILLKIITLRFVFVSSFSVVFLVSNSYIHTYIFIVNSFFCVAEGGRLITFYVMMFCRYAEQISI